MTPEDQTPQKSTTPGSMPDASRPTPWMPPSEDGTNATSENTESTEPTGTAGTSSESTESPAESFSAEGGSTTPQFGNTESVNSPESPAPTDTSFSPSDGSSAPTNTPAPSLTPPTDPQMPFQPSASPLPTVEQPVPFGVPTPPAIPSQPVPNGGASSKGKLLKLIILVIVLVVVVAAGYFGYKAIKHKNQTASVNDALNAATAKNKNTNATDVATLNNIKFSIPDSAVAGLTKQPNNGPAVNVSYYTTADSNCFVAFGTGNSTDIKGANISEIVNNYLDNIRKTGATVAAPTAGDPRVFKDAKDATKMYSMPSLNLTFAQGNEHAQGYYSGSLLKGGDRAIVETACDNKNGAVDQSEMTTVANIAKQLMITVQ